MIVEKSPVKQYVTFLRNGLVGIDAKTGKFLWMYNKTIDQGANILTPVVDGDRIFSAGSRTGGGLVKVRADGEGVTADEVYFTRKITPAIGGAVLINGKLYGSSPQAMFCADFETGDEKWIDRTTGPASLCYADGRLYVRSHGSGDVALVEPSSEAYKDHGRIKQPDRSKFQAWPHPVVANGSLYLRDQDVLLSYDIAAK
jgi:outer membrane protein assembly factor BamB